VRGYIAGGEAMGCDFGRFVGIVGFLVKNGVFLKKVGFSYPKK